MKYVIIGNSAAAVGCIEGIRSVDKEGSITVISDEKHHTYSRPLISYLLLGKTTEQKMKYRDSGFYKKNGVNAMLGEKALKIDPKAKTVTTDKGNVIEYDKLLCATGSSPMIPPMAGLETVKKQFTFMTLDSAKALKKAVDKRSKVLIVGAGLIGLKCAEGISESVGSITVVDLAPRILSSILDEKGAHLVQSHLEKHGLKFYLGDCVSQFEENTATLKSGAKLDFDTLVLAVGVRPNVSLVSEAGGKVERGIIIDKKMKTTLDDVYAAGDCTVSHDISSGTDRILALLPNAYMQGETAGINMAGGKHSFDKALPLNAIGFFGLHMVTAGSYIGEPVVKEKDGSYKALFCDKDRLKGFIMIGDIDKAGIYTSLIREKTPLHTLDTDLIFDHPSLMAFGKQKRAEMLAGAKKTK